MLRYAPDNVTRQTADKNARASSLPNIPIILVSGFLGAGKTRFLARALSEPALSHTLLIVNEFGDLGIDDAVLADNTSETLLLANGCLCCTLRGDLIAMLGARLRLMQQGEVPHFNRVVIETSGIADLQPLLESVVFTTRQFAQFQLGHVLVLVDGLHGVDILEREALAASQLAFADDVVMTKLDLADEASVAQTALMPVLQRLAPQAVIATMPQDEQGAAALLLRMAEDGASTIQSARFSVQANFVATPSSHAQYQSFVLRDDQPVSEAQLDQFFDYLSMAFGADILRVKGFVLCAAYPNQPLFIQGVGRSFTAPQRLDKWPQNFYETALVFIFRGDLTPAIINGYWMSVTREIGVDQADKAALQNNPLKIATGGLL